MKLCFMTFVCPEWDIETAVKFAARAGYQGIEIRVDAGHRHGISWESSAAERTRVNRLFAASGVEVASVATSVNFAFPDPKLHAENLASAKANLRLAADLGAPVVRIFAGGKIQALTTGAATQVAASFDEVGEFAAPLAVCPLLECGHDIITGSAEAADVIRRVTVANFGALWNHAVLDDATYAVLKGRLRHFHVHEEVLEPENTAILELARRMKPAGYRGYVSLEIIKGHNLPEDLLVATAERLRGYIASA